jgi:hypothetical protein
MCQTDTAVVDIADWQNTDPSYKFPNVNCRGLKHWLKKLRAEVISGTQLGYRSNSERCDLRSEAWKPVLFLTTVFGLDFYVLFSTLLSLPRLRFQCVGRCWDWTQDYGDFIIDKSDAQTSQLDLIPYSPPPCLSRPMYFPFFRVRHSSNSTV